jgi:hypothetical protein
MAARKGSNALALAKVVRIWRVAGRLDEGAELLVTLATDSAALVDAVRGTDSDASAGMQTDCITEHRQLIGELRRAVPPIRPVNPFDAIEAPLVQSLRVDSSSA